MTRLQGQRGLSKFDKAFDVHVNGQQKRKRKEFRKFNECQERK